MVFGMENDLALGNENEGGDGVVVPELVDDRIENPKSISKLKQEVTHSRYGCSTS